MYGNVVDVSDFNTNGTTGAELLQEVTFGTTISFQLSPTTLVPGAGTPDEFSFYFLDASQKSLHESDPAGSDSLFSITIDSTTLPPRVFTSTFAVAGVTLAGSQTAPEPGFLGFLACGVLVFLIWRRAPELLAVLARTFLGTTP